MQRPGIHFRLMFSAFLLFLTAFAVLGYLGAEMVQRFVLTRFEERNDFLAEYLAANAELGILIENKKSLDKLSRNLAEEKDVAKVEILDSQGRVLALVDKNLKGPYFISKSPVKSEQVSTGRAGISEDLQNTDEMQVGKVQITYSLQEIDSLMQSLKIKLLFLALGVVLCSLVIFYFISRSLVVPIFRLAATARKVAKGSRELRAKPGNIPETRELALAFNSMLDSLKQSNQALKQAYQEMMQQKTLAELGKFAMIIAHEVKNPLGIIKSSFDLLKKDLQIAQDNIMAEYIEDEIQRLNRLIEEFLNFSRPAKARFQVTELKSAVENWILRFETQLTQEDVSITYHSNEEQVYADVDADLLGRAFHNVLKNALEANSGQGLIEVSSCIQDNHFWLLKVADSGPGVSAELKEKIFEPFFTEKSKGTGLGLSFVQQVIRAHKGNVSVKNSAQSGAVFEINLPLN